MAGIHVVDHPLVQHKISLMRDKMEGFMIHSTRRQVFPMTLGLRMQTYTASIT